MIKREAKFQSTFNHYAKNILKQTAAFELKQCDASLAFSQVADHQINALLAAKTSVLVYKIPDVGYQNPFDSFSLHCVPAYIVVLFNDSRVFYGIPIDVFIQARDQSPRRSLRESDAKAIATFSGSV